MQRSRYRQGEAVKDLSKLNMDLHSVIYRDGEWYLSHCLELDIVGQGATEAEARQQMGEAIGMVIEDAIEHDSIDQLLTPAPPEIWVLYRRAKIEAEAREARKRRPFWHSRMFTRVTTGRSHIATKPRVPEGYIVFDDITEFSLDASIDLSTPRRSMQHA